MFRSTCLSSSLIAVAQLAWSTATAEPTLELHARDNVVARGERAILSWSTAQIRSCVASGAWRGPRSASGTFRSPPLTQARNVFSLSCDGEQGVVKSSVVVSVPDGAQFGLDFPGAAATEGTVRFRFTKPLDMYPATYIWRVFLRSQPEYYTTFFWGNDGEFRWDENGFPNSNYGAHPYPYPAPNLVERREQIGPRYWEIAVAGLDVLSETEVEYGRWHTQALRVWADEHGGKHHEFYWDLPDVSKVIKNTQPSSYGNKLPPKPALTWGDAPWAPSKEIMFGIIRGIQIYSTNLSLDEIQAEVNEPFASMAGRESIWYLNLDPSPSDISDHSGSNHQPEWVGAERPTAWTAEHGS
jgi:hypothetical protein